MDYSLTKIDWAAFDYIFSTNTRLAFQQLAEQLFCYEYGQPYGIYRFYNQPYIETMPIQYRNEWIGFQAKYYDGVTSFSSRESELISAISGAHEKYPNISKIVFYVNKEPGLSTKAKASAPDYIKRIENHGKGKGIEIEWRFPSQIETMLLKPELGYLRDYFFSANDSLRNTLEHINSHKKAIWDSISSNIQFRGDMIHVDNGSLDMDAFFSSEKPFFVLHGDGGTGKSSLAKESLKDDLDYPTFVFRMTDFNCTSTSEFIRKFGNCTLEYVLSAFEGALKKLCVIESAEKFFVLDNQDTFKDVLGILQAHGWRILLTIRSEYKDNFLNTVLQSSDVYEQSIMPLQESTFDSLAENYGIPFPSDKKLRELLSNLFLLKLFLSRPAMLESETVANFIDNVWQQVICDCDHQQQSLPVRRGDMICRIVLSNANCGSAYYVPEMQEDWEAITALSNSGVIQRDEALEGYFITHDGYEEIVLKHIISRAYRQKKDVSFFFSGIGDSLIMRKAFRLWLRDAIYGNESEIGDFLVGAMANEEIAPVWKDEILIALMSGFQAEHLYLLDSMLAQNDYQILFHALALLNTSCKIVDDDLLAKLLKIEERQIINCFRFTKPAGHGWEHLIQYVYEHLAMVQWTPINIMLTADVLYEWTKHNQNGLITKQAGLIGIYFFKLISSEDHEHYLSEDRVQGICDVILNSAREILPELEQLFNYVLSEDRTQFHHGYNVLCNRVLESSVDCGAICNAAPELVIKLAWHFWVRKEAKSDIIYYSSIADIESEFGLENGLAFKYHPTSALKTPVLALLQTAPAIAIDFIIELFNYTTEKYRDSQLNEQYSECEDVEIVFPNGKRTPQTMSARLWQMYRGTSVAPNLLECILMALERWLYYLLPDISDDRAYNICMKLLRDSHSAAITAVVTSIVTAYPQKLFPVACILLHTKSIFLYDIHRLCADYTANWFRGVIQKEKIYDQERINSNNLPFRKKRFEEIILNYQLKDSQSAEEIHNARLKLLYKAIDETFTPESDLSDYERFALYRMDLRKMKVVPADINVRGSSVFALESDLPDDLERIRSETSNRNENENEKAQLYLWSHKRFSLEDDSYKQYSQYESDPELALNRVVALAENDAFEKENLIFVASVLLRDFPQMISTDAYSYCKNTVISYLRTVMDSSQGCTNDSPTSAAISILPSLIKDKSDCDLLDNPAVILLAFVFGWGKLRSSAVNTFRNQMWETDYTLACNLLDLFVKLEPDYRKAVSSLGGMLPSAFFRSNAEIIMESVSSCKITYNYDFSELDTDALPTISLLLPTTLTSDSAKIIVQSGRAFWKSFFLPDYKLHNHTQFRDTEQIFDYLKWLAECLLNSKPDIRAYLLKALKPNFVPSRNFNHLLEQMIEIQNNDAGKDEFWIVWYELYDSIAEMCELERDSRVGRRENSFERYYGGEVDEVITTYLLAFPYWRENTHEWKALKTDSYLLFKKASAEWGYHPGVLFAVSRVLNTIGYTLFFDLGMGWLAEIVRNNPHLRTCALQMNTEYYIEEYSQRFIRAKRSEIRRVPKTRCDLFDVLSFLVDRGSTCGYMLRESIC